MVAGDDPDHEGAPADPGQREGPAAAGPDQHRRARVAPAQGRGPARGLCPGVGGGPVDVPRAPRLSTTRTWTNETPVPASPTRPVSVRQAAADERWAGRTSPAVGAVASVRIVTGPAATTALFPAWSVSVTVGE